MLIIIKAILMFLWVSFSNMAIVTIIFICLGKARQEEKYKNRVIGSLVLASCLFTVWFYI